MHQINKSSVSGSAELQALRLGHHAWGPHKAPTLEGHARRGSLGSAQYSQTDWDASLPITVLCFLPLSK